MTGLKFTLDALSFLVPGRYTFASYFTLTTHFISTNMTKIFSLKGKGLKFDAAVDVEPYLRDLAAMSDVEAIDISGNTWGIDAVKPFSEVLKGCKSIKVRSIY